ncbi:MAG: hypothetical protein SFY95_01710 [Planctomycetota bacterium]|nr:hypothetical protein [Planctomycetota bacterium]
MSHGLVPHRTSLASRRLTRAGLLCASLGAGLCVGAGGCGYSARDEYMQIQSMAVPPMASADPAREQAYLVWAASRDVTPDRALADAEAMRLSRAGR